MFEPELFLRAPFYSFSGYDLARLPEIVRQQVFRNAIFLASPAFYEVLAAKRFDVSLLSLKEVHTLRKYYNRMCFRPTPFGSFASFSWVKWGTASPVRLQADRHAILRVLPDQQRIYQHRQQPNPDFRKEILIVNPTLYRLGGEYRYIRSSPDAQGQYRFTLDAMDAEPFYQDLLRLVKSSPQTFDQLEGWICLTAGCSAAEACDHLEFLLNAQFLFRPSTGAVITGGELSPLPEYQVLPFDPHASLPDAADLWADRLRPMGNYPGRSAFYAALERPLATGSLDDHYRQEIRRAVDALCRIAPPARQGTLTEFIQAFQKRFDLAKVPLLTAIDPDAGVGYGELTPGSTSAAILNGLNFPLPAAKIEESGWEGARHIFFRHWMGNPYRTPYAEIRLEPGDLEGFPIPENLPLPNTLSVMFRKVEDHLLLEHTGGTTAAALIGRFSLFSEVAAEQCRKLAAGEQQANPGVIFADLGQWSDLHADNINRRLSVYDYEIPINVYSALPPEKQILPDDLLLSVRQGELILESARLGKRVIPRLATAFNFKRNDHPLFRLLCDLQYQGLQAAIQLNLERLFPGMSFYPRVSFQQTILCLAKWILQEQDLTELLSLEETAIPAGLRHFREKFGLPQRVSFGQADQQLIFNLADREESLFFVRCLKGIKHLVLQEYILPDRSVKKEHKAIAGQFIGFLTDQREIYLPLTTVTEQTEPLSRDFLLGSQWLYLKIYCTPRTAEGVIAEVIHPVIQRFRKRLSAWFFIRYADPGHHLRLRFRLPPDLIGPVMVALNQQLQTSGHDQLIQDFQGDTYRPELERYGPLLIGQIEALFTAGSDLVSRYILLRRAQKTAWSDFRLGLVTAEKTLAAFFDDPQEALACVSRVTAGLLAEFSGGQRSLRLELDRKYRDLRVDIERWLDRQSPVNLPVGLTGAGKTFFRQLASLKAAVAHAPKDQSFGLLADLVHMQLNRTLADSQRKQELLIYYCLEKYLNSISARQRR